MQNSTELERQFLIRVGSEMRMRRKTLGVPQMELAKRMGMSQPAVALMEKAGNTTLSTLYRACTALGVKPVVRVVGPDETYVALGEPESQEEVLRLNRLGERMACVQILETYGHKDLAELVRLKREREEG